MRTGRQRPLLLCLGELRRIGGADAQLDRRSAGGAAIDAEVLRSRSRLRGADRVTEGRLQRPAQPLDESGVVHDDFRGLLGQHEDARLTWRAGGERLCLGDALDAGEQPLLHFGLVGPHGELELRVIRDDVALGPGAEGAHRHDRRIERVVLARHERLERSHRAGSDHDGVDGTVGRGAVAALAVENDVHRIRCRRSGPGDEADVAGGHEVGVVQPEDEIRLREAGEETVLHHRVGAGDRLFRRLADEHQRSMPTVLLPREQRRCAHPRRHVDVMPARMHHRRDLAGIGLRRDRACIRKPGGLLERQRVHVGANQDGGPIAVAQNADDAGAANMLGDLEPQLAQARGQLRGRLVLVLGQLRIAVQVLVERVELWIDAVESRKLGRRLDGLGLDCARKGEED